MSALRGLHQRVMQLRSQSTMALKLVSNVESDSLRSRYDVCQSHTLTENH
ncbi:hypothetical protein [Nostoc sp. PA-18-2419]|nr:hypothetical protein [Nostoc sp. PA-18-2419]